jgi:hypothetical protein
MTAAARAREVVQIRQIAFRRTWAVQKKIFIAFNVFVASLILGLVGCASGPGTGTAAQSSPEAGTLNSPTTGSSQAFPGAGAGAPGVGGPAGAPVGAAGTGNGGVR